MRCTALTAPRRGCAAECAGQSGAIRWATGVWGASRWDSARITLEGERHGGVTSANQRHRAGHLHGDDHDRGRVPRAAAGPGAFRAGRYEAAARRRRKAARGPPPAWARRVRGAALAIGAKLLDAREPGCGVAAEGGRRRRTWKCSTVACASRATRRVSVGIADVMTPHWHSPRSPRPSSRRRSQERAEVRVARARRAVRRGEGRPGPGHR